MSLVNSFNLSLLKKHNKKRAGFGGGTSTSTQSTDPWSGQQPYLTDVMSQAQNQFQTVDPQYYSSSTVADFNPTQTQAIGAIANTGMNGTPALDAANTATMNTLNADPSNNPYFQSMADQIMSTVQPGIQRQFAQGNSMNNPAAAYATANGLGTALGSTMFGNYNQGVANQLNAAGTAQNLYGTQISGQQAALGAGQTQQEQDQAKLSDLVNRWNFNQTQPYSKLNQYSNLVSGQYGGTTTSSTPQQSLLGSLFSDRRLKENIVQIAVAANSLPVYEFNYIGSDERVIGLMADEVIKVMPSAVMIDDETGYYKVNYDLALGGNNGNV